MLQLSGKVLSISGFEAGQIRPIFSVSQNPKLPAVTASAMGYLGPESDTDGQFAFYLVFTEGDLLSGEKPKVLLPKGASFLADRDIIRINTVDKSYRVLFRAQAPSNSLLLTERCNHYCLMCSQPPRDVDDSWLVDDIEKVLTLIPPSAAALGFTGGEPTLLKDRFLKLVRLTRNYLPHTGLHILSNGRSFSDLEFSKRLSGIRHPDLMMGIPVYSADPGRHDYVVQARGAFEETIRGILNLKRTGTRVEIRVVLHKQTIDGLLRLAEFISRNLLLVDQVALMGLEVTGFTKGNLPKLWVDPWDYRHKLEEAVQLLAAYRINVKVFNHQLCTVTDAVRPYCVKSISDWKSEYLEACVPCAAKSACGGLFSSTIKEHHSKHIHAIV